MKEIIVFVSDDGKEFYSKEKCEEYEKLVNRVNDIMANFRPNKNEKGQNIAVKQNTEMVKEAYHKFIGVCADVMSKHSCGNVFKNAKTGNEYVHPSHLQYYLSEYSNDYPILWTTYCRFENINFNSEIEYTQPYYARHEDEYKLEIN